MFITYLTKLTLPIVRVSPLLKIFNFQEIKNKHLLTNFYHSCVFNLSPKRLIVTIKRSTESHFWNPNMRVYLIIDTCLVRTFTNYVLALRTNLLKYTGSVFKSIQRYYYELLLYNWQEVKLSVTNQRSASTHICWGMSQNWCRHNWHYLQMKYILQFGLSK